MLLGRRMVSIYQEIVIFRMKQRKRFTFILLLVFLLLDLCLEVSTQQPLHHALINLQGPRTRKSSLVFKFELFERDKYLGENLLVRWDLGTLLILPLIPFPGYGWKNRAHGAWFRIQRQGTTRFWIICVHVSPSFHGKLSNNTLCFLQQLMELQELYNSQLLLTSELSDKLEKTEV